jgi:hypothetical protein
VVLMLRSMAGGFGCLLIVDGLFLGQGAGLIGGSVRDRRGRWAGHCQLEQFEGDFRPFAAIDQVACDI